MKKIYVDIDETICEYKGKRVYALAQPIQENIDIINELYDRGNHITYWTARGTTTGLNWEAITKSQFISWGVKYHELKFGKPDYDVFICDKVLNSSDICDILDNND